MANIGKISYLVGRAGVQANKIIVPANFLMLVYLTTQNNPMWLVLLPLAGLGGIAFLYFDYKKVISDELAFWFDKNPRFTKMTNDIEEIKVMMRHE